MREPYEVNWIIGDNLFDGLVNSIESTLLGAFESMFIREIDP